ncbi:LLM class flavin-dependent oxidoreductase [Cohnella sp. GbtcB17]|uniref:LLM class flavin-dependent oxidoreductase n=1 Tax=Cohnella sp. GbtcB17 TaxID=2824762 RepID=UPI001C305871|nr:LLM class flavin-dependent oxidoreductase [Cohnella sp. GbtcB17]
MTPPENLQSFSEFEFGIYSLGELLPDSTGQAPSGYSRVQDIIASAKMADEAGLDLFGIGEHHRLDFVTSSYAMILSAIAQATEKIRVISTLSVLSTADPVRVYEDFATLDLISSGRAELIAGRGAFLESFELFGADLRQYDTLFDEKINLLLKLNQKEEISWSGKFRPPLREASIAPRPYQPALPIWIGVGGTPESAVRAGKLGVGMALGILSGDPRRIKPLVDLYREAGIAAGHDPSRLRVSVNGHSYVAATTEQAVEEFQPHYVNYFSYFMKERGHSFNISKSELYPMTKFNDVLAVGSPDQLVEKILYQHELFGHSRFMGQLDMGGQPLSRVASAIELLATKVAPVVRRELKKK